MSVERVWKYYCETGKISGFGMQNYFLKDDNNTIRNRPVTDQNRLVKAFLGDEQAKGETEEGLRNGLLSPEDKERMENLFKDWDEECKHSVIPVPNEAQREAIRNALNYPISLVQGPPGTGKTETILNLLSMIHELYPERTVAVVSSNNEALINIYDELSKYRKKEPKHHISKLYVKYSVLGSQKNRRLWKRKLGSKSESANLIDEDDRFSIFPDYLRERPLFSSTVHSLGQIFKNHYTNEEALAFDNQFDYVIMDESSQSKITFGLAAMTCAKNIVFVGDDNQLPPIIEEAIKELNANSPTERDGIPEEYAEAEGRSILSTLPQIFPDVKSTYLNEHYRCHKSIISFCNEYVYKATGNELDIVSGDDPDGFRMRAIWYEGDYCEKLYREKKDKKDEKDDYIVDICNQKQIEIAVSEIKTRNEKGDFKDKSLIVLSPFRAEIEILKKRLREEGIKADVKSDDEYKDLSFKSLDELTVHKAQGKGCDVIYFLTVVDYYSSGLLPEWFQQMRMINVAVSRAKKEFCVVTSSRWLPESVQEELTGYVLDQGPHVGVDYDENNEDRNKEKMFCCKLLEYICSEENRKKWRSDPHFGLHKYEYTSVFDKIPVSRDQRRHGLWTHRDHESAAEESVYELLTGLTDELDGGYEVLEHVPLQYLKRRGVVLETCGDIELRKFVGRDWTTLDFVICKGRAVKLIIEVDGSYHRGADIDADKRQQVNDNDNKKNRWICDKDKLNGGKIFIRMPTDGTFVQTYQEVKGKGIFKAASRSEEIRDEREFIKRLLSKNTASSIYIAPKDKNKCKNAGEYKKLKQDVLDKLNDVIEKSYEEFSKFADPENLSEDALRVLAGLNFEKAESVEYKDGQQHNFYICRYAPAYAFDYSLIYDIVMRSMKKSGTVNMDVTSFGCGTMIDALAMVYAKASLAAMDTGYGDIKMTYTGIDAANWGKFFVPPIKGEFYLSGDIDKNVKAAELSDLDKRIRSNFDMIRLHRLNIVDDIDKIKENPNAYLGNVIIFPRILNELHSKTGADDQKDFSDPEQPINKFMDKFIEVAFDKTDYDEYYICVSHSKHDRTFCMLEIDKLVNSLTDENRFEDVRFKAESNIYVMMGMKDAEGNMTDKEAMDSFRCTWTGGGEDELTAVDSLLPDDRTKPDKYPAANKCFIFKSVADNYVDEINKEDEIRDVERIKNHNGDFECTAVPYVYLKNLQEAANAVNNSRLSEVRTAQISTVRYTLFQIIKLKKKKKK